MCLRKSFPSSSGVARGERAKRVVWPVQTANFVLSVAKMPRTKKGIVKKIVRSKTAQSQQAFRGVERTAKTCSAGTRSQTSQTTGATTKRQNTTASLPRAKRQHVANPQESESEEVEAEATEEEFDNTPLTRAYIPKIVEAVLGNHPVRYEGKCGYFLTLFIKIRYFFPLTAS